MDKLLDLVKLRINIIANIKKISDILFKATALNEAFNASVRKNQNVIRENEHNPIPSQPSSKIIKSSANRNIFIKNPNTVIYNINIKFSFFDI